MLAELRSRLTGPSSGPRVVALHGLGGVGKTSLATEYAYRHLAEVSVTWHLSAEDPIVLASEFIQLAAQLGVRDLLDNRDPVASVHAVLAARATPWLLIFDNADDRASISRFLPPAGPGQVLITTQSPNWPSGQALEVPVLFADIAASFLTSRTEDSDLATAAILADELGGLPLALEQAAAYALATGTSLTCYLRFFRERRTDLLARGEPSGYAKTVATTWSVAFARLNLHSPRAAGLLRLLASCAPEPVPLNLLLHPGEDLTGQLPPDLTQILAPLLDDELAVNDAVSELRRYSLITFAGNQQVLVHRLVKAVTRDQMSPGHVAQWHEAAATLIEASLPADSEQPAAWPAFAALLPHAQDVLDACSVGLIRATNYLGHRGGYEAARDQFAALVAARQRILGPEHPDTLAARHNLARWTGGAGDAAAARDQFAALVPVLQRILGPEHPDTLAARHNLARWTGVAGDSSAARDLYSALLPMLERVQGPEHRTTLITYHNLAHFTGRAGDAAGARDQFAALLPSYERVLGVEHPGTLSTRSNLATCTGRAGDPAAARDQLAALLPIGERVRGPEHPRTLTTRHALAIWTGRAGDPAAARDQLAALLPIRERIRGPEHPRTLTTRHALAIWTGRAGDPAAARDQLAALLPIRERILGPRHIDTLATRSDFDYWTSATGSRHGD